MSQGIEEIRHFRKSLGISGNASVIEEIVEFPRQIAEAPGIYGISSIPCDTYIARSQNCHIITIILNKKGVNL